MMAFCLFLAGQLTAALPALDWLIKLSFWCGKAYVKEIYASKEVTCHNHLSFQGVTGSISL
jgi:hypothetical protein